MNSPKSILHDGVFSLNKKLNCRVIFFSILIRRGIKLESSFELFKLQMLFKTLLVILSVKFLSGTFSIVDCRLKLYLVCSNLTAGVCVYLSSSGDVFFRRKASSITHSVWPISSNSISSTWPIDRTTFTSKTVWSAI